MTEEERAAARAEAENKTAEITKGLMSKFDETPIDKPIDDKYVVKPTEPKAVEGNEVDPAKILEKPKEEESEKKPAEKAAEIPADVVPGKEELTEEELDEVEKSLQDKAADSFKHLRLKMKELLDKPASVSNDERVSELQTKLDEKDSVLKKIDLRQSSWFKETYDKPIREAVDEIGALCEELGVDKNMAGKALNMPLKQRLQFLSENVENSDARSMLLERFSIFNKRAKEKGQALENWKQESQKAQEANEQQGGQVLETHFDQAATKLADSSLLLRKSATSEEHNTARLRRLEKAKSLLKSSPEEIVELIIKGSLAEELEERYIAEYTERTRLQDLEASRVGARPKLGGGSSTPPAKGQPNATSGKDLVHGLMYNK